MPSAAGTAQRIAPAEALKQETSKNRQGKVRQGW